MYFSQVFSVYLVSLGLAWLIFLYFDIRRHQNKIRSQASGAKSKGSQFPGFQAKSVATKPIPEEERKSQSKHRTTNNNNNNGVNPAFRFTSVDEPVFNRHAYIFCHSRHSGSFYLKIGAAGCTSSFLFYIGNEYT